MEPLVLRLVLLPLWQNRRLLCKQYGANVGVIASLLRAGCSSWVAAMPSPPPTAPGSGNVMIHEGADGLTQPKVY